MAVLKEKTFFVIFKTTLFYFKKFLWGLRHVGLGGGGKMDEWTPALAALVVFALVMGVFTNASGWAILPTIGALAPVLFLMSGDGAADL